MYVNDIFWLMPNHFLSHGFCGEWLSLIGQFVWLTLLARAVARKNHSAQEHFILTDEYTICTEPNSHLAQPISTAW
jgi:hypothetical protein